MQVHWHDKWRHWSGSVTGESFPLNNHKAIHFEHVQRNNHLLVPGIRNEHFFFLHYFIYSFNFKMAFASNYPVNCCFKLPQSARIHLHFPVNQTILFLEIIIKKK